MTRKLMISTAAVALILSAAAFTTTAQASDPAKARPVDRVICSPMMKTSMFDAMKLSAPTLKMISLPASFLDDRRLGQKTFAMSVIKDDFYGAKNFELKTAFLKATVTRGYIDDPAVLGQSNQAAGFTAMRVMAAINISDGSGTFDKQKENATFAIWAATDSLKTSKTASGRDLPFDVATLMTSTADMQKYTVGAQK